jgi:hypothetical protein
MCTDSILRSMLYVGNVQILFVSQPELDQDYT